jgi:hypothetical protein
MQIELPVGVESLAREKAARAGFDDVGEYVASLVLHDEASAACPLANDATEESVAGIADWSERDNARRCELIDKDIQETISEVERRELTALSLRFREYRRRIAPLPVAGARRLHAKLLETKRRGEQIAEG